MKKVKILLAMVALVAMVAVASVSQAAGSAVDVGGTIGSITTITACTGADFVAMDTEEVLESQSCTGTMTYTVGTGYDLSYYSTTGVNFENDLDGTNDYIDSGTTCTSGAAECFSYNFDETDANAVTENTSTTEGVLPITSAEVQTASTQPYDGAYGFTFNVVTLVDSASGTYSNDGLVTVSPYTA